MNILLTILTVIGALIVILLITALFVKKAYALEQEITINKPGQEVFDYIKYLRNTDNYNKWVMTDPNMRKEYRGTDGTPGFVYAWDSDNKRAGKGEQEIKNITEGKRMDYEIRFEKPFEGVAAAFLAPEPLSGTQTKVILGFSSGMKYPMNIMFLMNLEAMLAKDMQISLNNLKAVVEKQ